jgi:hypothetical protein
MHIASFENRVMDLCSRAVNAQDDKEVQQLIAELRDLLHERIEQLRNRLVFTTVVSTLASKPICDE